MGTTDNKQLKVNVAFSAFDKSYVDYEVDNKEEEIRNKDYVSWGSSNNYPNYLYDLYKSVPTLSAIIDGIVDYVCGDEIRVSLPNNIANNRGESFDEVFRELAFSKVLTGGFAIQANRTKDFKEIAECYCLPMRFVRTDKDLQSFTYCEGFGERWNKKKEIIFPKFVNGWRQEQAVLYRKTAGTEVYPIPLYASAVSCCEIERLVNEYHLSAINNGFAGSFIINFNNGVPEEAIKKQIEREFNEKFAGAKNTARTMFAWNENKENAITVEKLDVEDYGEKYNSLVKRVEQQIYTCFRATPNLFGVATESNGFNAEEYGSAFKLFNRTVIAPMQKQIVSAMNEIYGEGVFEIVPFNINFSE